MRNCRLGDTIWTQIGKNSSFSGADGGLELQPHIFVGPTCTPGVGLCHKADTVCPHTSHQQAKVGGGREWMEPFPCSPALALADSVTSAAQESHDCRGTNYSEASFLSHRMYACLSFSSVPPRLNSGLMPRCEHWDDGLKLTELCT